MLLVFRIYRRATSAIALITPGARVGDVQMMLGREANVAALGRADTLVLREQARELSKTDPQRAAHLLRAWVESDGAQHAPANEGAARR
jgi:flagellar biosynthesis/type III secretory pathway M-ring protein FliF/YscJ